MINQKLSQSIFEGALKTKMLNCIYHKTNSRYSHNMPYSVLLKKHDEIRKLSGQPCDCTPNV